MFYRVPDALSYDWTGGPEPSFVSGARLALGGSTLGYVEWFEPLKFLSAPIAVSGIDSSTGGLDSLRTLIAGTLLGVAGGALVGAIQEFTHRKEDALLAQIGPPG